MKIFTEMRKSKLIVLCGLLLCTIVFCVMTQEKIHNRLKALLNVTPGWRIPYTLEESKETGTFVCEYQVGEKDIFYRDSIRNIHFNIESAFIVNGYDYYRDEPNYIEVMDYLTYLIIRCEPLSSGEIEGLSKRWNARFSECSYSISNNTITCYLSDSIIAPIPPNSMKIHIVTKEKYDINTDTLAVINLYKIKE